MIFTQRTPGLLGCRRLARCQEVTECLLHQPGVFPSQLPARLSDDGCSAHARIGGKDRLGVAFESDLCEADWNS